MDQNHQRLFGAVQQLGLGWFKQRVDWSSLNPAPGQYNWAALDAAVESAHHAGVNILLTVSRAPSWARPPGDTDQGPPADNATFAAFLRELAGRYRGRVRAYEIWNQQNLYYEWGGRGKKLSASRYVQLLAAAYQAIKSVDASALVVSGGLTPTGYNDGDVAIDDRVYLGQMYDAGVASYCDAIGAHPSGYNNRPDGDWRCYSAPGATYPAARHPSWFFQGTLQAYRDIMVERGDAGKPAWVTLFGWAAIENVTATVPRGYEYAADNTEAEQAAFLVQAFDMGRACSWIGPMFLWNLNMGPLGGATHEAAAWSIVYPDWAPRPAFTALAALPK